MQTIVSQAKFAAKPQVGAGCGTRAPFDDAVTYLRDELIYVQSAYRQSKRDEYLRDQRAGRCIRLQLRHREACLEVLEAWEEWLAEGHLCDVHGLSLTMAEQFLNEKRLAELRAKFPTHHVLVDEVQDYSTLELRMLRKLVVDENAPNAYFFVGDVNQKVYAKQFRPIAAGFDFRGRSAVLTKNYRNTRQILEAAIRLPAHFPPQADEAFDRYDPDLSEYDGGRPLAIDCTAVDQVTRIAEIVDLRADVRIAVVSEDDKLLARLCNVLRERGRKPYLLVRNDDIDCWRKQHGDSLSARLVVGRMEAVKGFEFDTLVVADLSEGSVPTWQVPQGEWWRSAAVVYSALTRARDELILTYVGKPSVFVEVMREHLDFASAADEDAMRTFLGATTASNSPGKMQKPTLRQYAKASQSR